MSSPSALPQTNIVRGSTTQCERQKADLDLNDGPLSPHYPLSCAENDSRDCRAADADERLGGTLASQPVFQEVSMDVGANLSLNDELTLLRRKNEELVHANKELLEKNVKLTDENCELIDEYDELIDENDELTLLRRKNEELVHANKELLEKNVKLTDENHELIDEYNELIDENDEFRTRMKKSRKSMQELQGELRRMVEDSCKVLDPEAHPEPDYGVSIRNPPYLRDSVVASEAPANVAGNVIAGIGGKRALTDGGLDLAETSEAKRRRLEVQSV
ncbi:hypothetical protein AAF712_007979 [Marasmius tenuissimus]|uniref:Uncharacterized protein n=1 Tax=Marasmius tenuissimus TaxID=585030 RepID=A0ABR2ZUA5_9AGAR